MKKSDLPATPPADEALPNWVCYADQEFKGGKPHFATYNRALGGCSEHPWSGGGALPEKPLKALIKSHAEQEKAAAVLEARIDELLWVTKTFDDAHVDTVIDFRIHGLRKELAELRDGGGK
jgi:hypothetical protein